MKAARAEACLEGVTGAQRFGQWTHYRRDEERFAQVARYLAGRR